MTESEAAEKAGDVSNQAVAVLLVLTILVTVVGTWLVIDALTGVSAAAAPPPPGGAAGQQQAEISLDVLPQPYGAQVAQVGLTVTTPQQ